MNKNFSSSIQYEKLRWYKTMTVKIIIEDEVELKDCAFITGFYGLGATGYK